MMSVDSISDEKLINSGTLITSRELLKNNFEDLYITVELDQIYSDLYSMIVNFDPPVNAASYQSEFNSEAFSMIVIPCIASKVASLSGYEAFSSGGDKEESISDFPNRFRVYLNLLNIGEDPIFFRGTTLWSPVADIDSYKHWCEEYIKTKHMW